VWHTNLFWGDPSSDLLLTQRTSTRADFRCNLVSQIAQFTLRFEASSSAATQDPQMGTLPRRAAGVENRPQNAHTAAVFRSLSMCRDSQRNQ
tara:strand:+ start:1344 stop:1619 length:276 start_codon:yes stop_codon:yes gene_type:complete